MSGFVLCTPHPQGLEYRLLGLIGLLADLFALVGGQLRDARHKLPADLAVPASEVLDLDRLELRLAARAGDRGQRLVAQRGRLRHAAFLRRISSRITAAA